MTRDDRREHPRLSIAVQVDLKSGCNFYSAKTRDISTGGLFIETDVALPIGIHLEVDLRFLDKHVRVASEVMWALTEGDRHVGVGVRFLDLTPVARKSIEAFLVLRRPLSCGELAPEATLPTRRGPPPLPASVRASPR